MRSGALDTCISPTNGWLRSSIRKIATEADNAKTKKAAINIGFGLAKRPKLAKMIVSQRASAARNGIGIELSAWANNNKRFCARSVLIWTARAWSER